MLNWKQARLSDAPAILELYRRCAKSEYSCWNDQYPFLEIVEQDCRQGGLYMLEELGQPIAAGAVTAADEVLDLSWDPQITSALELSRIAVDPERQNQGLGGVLLEHLMEEARKKGADGVLLLASKDNPAALALYRRHGFLTRGDVFRYDLDFWCMDRKL